MFYLAAASPRYERLTATFAINALLGLSLGVALAAYFGAAGMLASFALVSVGSTLVLVRRGRPMAASNPS
jgi:hypothetical protein